MAAAGSSLKGWREELWSRGPEVGIWEVLRRLILMNAWPQTKVKALSPHHRFVIALHSPAGVVETGLHICLPEKAPQDSL
jgi:hypothetical protein